MNPAAGPGGPGGGRWHCPMLPAADGVEKV